MFSQTTIRKFTAKSLEGKASKKQLEDHEAELLKNTNAEAKKTSADIVNAQKLLENVEKKKAAATARAASVAEEKLVFLESKNLPRRKKRNEPLQTRSRRSSTLQTGRRSKLVSFLHRYFFDYFICLLFMLPTLLFINRHAPHPHHPYHAPSIQLS